ncbi:MAG TPA: pyridoxal phosphate-dependent aminotransferase [Pyrinomonadaceae bacterium]|nr:pyridoxal phosphate-dependent aminotransferase [Pyrinomonadaceae bacterium]
MSFPVSDNVAAMSVSSTMKAAAKAAALRDQGIDVIDLTLGEPDFETPEFIREYAVEGLQKGFTKYTPSTGLKLFQSSIAEFYGKQFGAEIDPGSIVASCGGKQALFNAACTILNLGDELLIPQPYWVTFPEIGNFCKAKNVFIDTESSDFILTADQVRAAITDKTKLIILNSPSNPSGRVIPPAEMIRIIETCAESGVYVLTDECYLFFAYPPAEVFTSAALPAGLREFVCVAGSFSKTFAMTGWRIGFTIANPEWTKAIAKLQSHSATHPTSFVQYACARAMNDADKTLGSVKDMLAEYGIRREYLIPALNSIPGFKCAMPEGAFYAFVDVRGLLGGEFKTSADVADFLLEKAHTVVTDGDGFGADGFLRISYATSMENLERAVEGIKTAFSAVATQIA